MMEIYKKIIELNEQGIDMVICTVVGSKGSTPLKEGAKMIVTHDQSFGTVGGGKTESKTINEARELLNIPKIKKMEIELISKESTSCGGVVEIFFEPVIQNFKLYIFGGGHVAKALAEVCANIGFDITVIDDRKEIIDEWNLRSCRALHADFIDFIGAMKFDFNTFIVIITYEHSKDWDILSRCINSEWAYLGLMGSKNKIRGMKRKLVETGVPNELIEKTDMPIGIEINSESAKEIAVSITAKLILEKNKLKKKIGEL